MIHKFTLAQTNILLALATYKYLTPSQIVDLGIMNQASNVRDYLSTLRKEGSFVGKKEFGCDPEKGRLENVHFLKPKGKRVLLEGQLMEEDNIKLPLGRNSLFSKDYFHRKSTTDFQICLNLWLQQQTDVELLFFDTYFDKIGNNRRDKNLKAKTKIDLHNDRYLIADAIFMLQTSEREYLYCLEVCNGKDTNRIVRQTKQYLEAIALGSASDKYKHKKAVRVLSVFEHNSTKEAVLNRISKDADFDGVEKLFLFKSLEEVMEGKVLEGWCNGKWRLQGLF